MRILALAGPLLLLSSLASAQVPMFEVAKGSGSVQNVLVNSTAVNVDSSSRTLTNRFTIEIWNDDSANSVFCAPTQGVSATATNVNYGRRVSPRSSLVWAVPHAVKIWCVSDGGSGGARLVLTQLH